MSAFRDFVAASLADLATPGLRRPVEDIIYETLDRRQIPSRTDFHEIRDLLNGLRGQVSGAVSGLGRLIESDKESSDRLDELEQKIEELMSNPSESGPERAQLDNTANESISELKSKISSLEAKVLQLETIISQGSQEKQETSVKVVKTKICAVPGCNQKVRARGFCQPHYQKWKRNTLPGFVTFNNQIKAEDGSVITVDRKLSGKTYHFKDGELYINGEKHTPST